MRFPVLIYLWFVIIICGCTEPNDEKQFVSTGIYEGITTDTELAASSRGYVFGFGIVETSNGIRLAWAKRIPFSTFQSGEFNSRPSGLEVIDRVVYFSGGEFHDQFLFILENESGLQIASNNIERLRDIIDGGSESLLATNPNTVEQLFDNFPSSTLFFRGTDEQR